MTTRKTVKTRRTRRVESPRYTFRITDAQHQRLQQMGSVERRKFVKFVRERFSAILGDWDIFIASPGHTFMFKERNDAP